MTELEKIQYAKTFIDKLANGINPLDDSPIPEGDIVNHVRLSRCFFYVSDILRQVIDNGGVTVPAVAPVSAPVSKPKKGTFFLPDEVRSTLKASEIPLSVSEMTQYLNDLADLEACKKLAATAITLWLVDMGMMAEVTRPDGQKQKMPTPEGEALGLLIEQRMGQYGPYQVVLYAPSAQQFVYDHLEAIVESKEAFDAKRKEERKEARERERDRDRDREHEREHERLRIPSILPSVLPSAVDLEGTPWTAAYDE